MIKKIREAKIVKYLFSAGFSFALDLFLFWLLLNVIINSNDGYSILIAAVCARVVSSFINYILNRNMVFGSNNNTRIDLKTMFQYYLLVVIQLAVSTICTIILNNFIKIDTTVIKGMIDILIFVVNYFVQKFIIFNKEIVWNINKKQKEQRCD